MASTLDDLRAYRQAIDALQSGLGTMSGVLDTVTKQVRALVGETALQELLKLEAEWLARAERFVVEVQRLRHYEVERFWPAVWSRWATATLLAMLGIALFGIGFAWETRPYRDQIAELQPRAALGDEVNARLAHMTPDERRRFDALMHWNQPKK